MKVYTNLEGDDANADHAQPELGKGVFATQETGVEESNTGNHNPDQSGGGEDPGDVTEVEDGITKVMRDKVRRWGGRSIGQTTKKRDREAYICYRRICLRCKTFWLR